MVLVAIRLLAHFSSMSCWTFSQLALSESQDLAWSSGGFNFQFGVVIFRDSNMKIMVLTFVIFKDYENEYKPIVG